MCGKICTQVGHVIPGTELTIVFLIGLLVLTLQALPWHLNFPSAESIPLFQGSLGITLGLRYRCQELFKEGENKKKGSYISFYAWDFPHLLLEC